MTRCSLYLPNKAKPNTGSETAPGDNNKLAAVFMSCIVSAVSELKYCDCVLVKMINAWFDDKPMFFTLCKVKVWMIMENEE